MRYRFRWYWLLTFETTMAFFAMGFAIVILLDIPPWVKVVCGFILVMVSQEASEFGKRLRVRLGSDWVDRPMSWRVFWWLVVIIIFWALSL